MHVDVDGAELGTHSAGGAGTHGDRDLANEDLAEEPSGGIPIQPQIGVFHRYVPVGPNRSVFTRLGS